MATLPPIPENIAELTAPLLIGALLNYAAYGILAVQVCIYHIAFPKDAKRFKTLVYSIFILETVQVCLAAADIYYWFAAGYGNLIRLGRLHFSHWDDPFLCGVSAIIAHLFFCYRIWSLNKKAWWISVLIACISVVQLYGAISAAVWGTKVETFIRGSEDKRDALMWLVGNAAADVVIAVTLTYLLLRARREDQPRTNNILVNLARMVIETNCLTAVVAVISLVVLLSLPSVPYFVCSTAILGKLYSNSLLITLNNRLFFYRNTSSGQVLSTFDAGAPSQTVVRLRSTTLKKEQSSVDSVSGNYALYDVA